MKFGLLLPHFGKECSYERIFGQIKDIEKAGFNSVWVRDHLIFQPHEFEGKHTLFLEAFTTLSALAALTDKLYFGTATIITYRHPLVTSQLFGTLNYIAKGRIIPGIGAGTPIAPFKAIGLPYEKRGKIVEELLQILRLTWTQEKVSFHGEFYNFDDVTIDPRPAPDTPIYYGGMSKAAIRRTAQYCDGWLPQRTPFLVLDKQISHLRKMEEKYGRDKKTAISYFPLTNIDKDSKRARERIGYEGILNNLDHMIKTKGWDKFGMTEASEENMDGVMVVGSPAEVVEQLGAFADRGFDEIVFDLRNTFDEWEHSIELLATEVLPKFK